MLEAYWRQGTTLRYVELAHAPKMVHGALVEDHTGRIGADNSPAQRTVPGRTSGPIRITVAIRQRGVNRPHHGRSLSESPGNHLGIYPVQTIRRL